MFEIIICFGKWASRLEKLLTKMQHGQLGGMFMIS